MTRTLQYHATRARLRPVTVVFTIVVLVGLVALTWYWAVHKSRIVGARE